MQLIPANAAGLHKVFCSMQSKGFSKIIEKIFDRSKSRLFNDYLSLQNIYLTGCKTAAFCLRILINTRFTRAIEINTLIYQGEDRERKELSRFNGFNYINDLKSIT